MNSGISQAIISYITTTKFPDITQDKLYLEIYTQLSPIHQDQIITDINKIELYKTGSNFFALHKLCILLISRDCMKIIKCFIQKNIFILACIPAIKHNKFITILELLSMENNGLLKLDYLQYVNEYFLGMQILDIYTKHYSFIEISKYFYNEIMSEAIDGYSFWSSFTGSMRETWIKALIKWRKP